MLDIVVWTVIFGLIFDYTNGLHDAANVVSTSIATKVLKPASAILMATFFNFLGATQISQVAHTITTGLIECSQMSQTMVLSAVIGAIAWNFLTWYFGIPSSSSYAIVGGLIGSAWIHGGRETILWDGLLYKVIIPMVLSPIFGLCIALLLMKCLMKTSAKNSPFLKYFQLCSAGTVALSHGLNDAQKSMGIIMLGLSAAGFLEWGHVSPPMWVIGACAVMMALGTATGGFRIIRTLGFEITKLSVAQGFIAESSASCVILVASFLGMPLSSTHIIVGAIVGVGMARGVRYVRLATIQKLLWAWGTTIPCSALFSAFVWKCVQYVFRGS